jgi:hypothetical protein
MEALIGKSVTLEAVVFPPCECGKPYTQIPVNYGTVYFKSKDWLANALFAVERFFQRLRAARLRRL